MNKRPSQMALRARILALRWRRAHAAIRVLAADSIAAQTEFIGADALAMCRATAYQVQTAEVLREIEHQMRRTRRVMKNLKEYRA